MTKAQKIKLIGVTANMLFKKFIPSNLMKTATELEKLFHPIEGYVKLSLNLKKNKKGTQECGKTL